MIIIAVRKTWRRGKKKKQTDKHTRKRTIVRVYYKRMEKKMYGRFACVIESQDFVPRKPVGRVSQKEEDAEEKYPTKKNLKKKKQNCPNVFARVSARHIFVER